MSDDLNVEERVSGIQERNRAKHWAILNAERMRHSLVIIASPNGNAEAHGGGFRAFVARRPITFAIIAAALGALARGLA